VNPLADRYRKQLSLGLSPILDQRSKGLSVSSFSGPKGTTCLVPTEGHEFVVTLVYGTVTVELKSEPTVRLGPRPNPFEYMAHALLISGHGSIRLVAEEECLVILALSPSLRTGPTQIIGPSDIRVNERGEQNWRRQVRLLCWSDNTEGDQLLVGETFTPSGNWSSVPPHQHQGFIEGEGSPLEVPYEEAYYFLFSQPHGFALSRHFNFDQSIDESFVLLSHDLLHVKKGFHPVVCAPGAAFYHLTMMVGPYRLSSASIHPDFRSLIGDKDENNPFRNQENASRRNP